MADEQDRLMRARSMQPHDNIFLAIGFAAVIGARPEHMNVAVGESRVAKALRHSFRRGGNAADRIGSIDFDQLLENVEREFARRFVL
jgi:hypothetical protein